MRRSVLTGSSACADDDDREADDASKPRHKSLPRHAPLQAGHPVIPGQRIAGKAVPNATFRAYWIVRMRACEEIPLKTGTIPNRSVYKPESDQEPCSISSQAHARTMTTERLMMRLKLAPMGSSPRVTPLSISLLKARTSARRPIPQTACLPPPRRYAPPAISALQAGALPHRPMLWWKIQCAHTPPACRRNTSC